MNSSANLNVLSLANLQAHMPSDIMFTFVGSITVFLNFLIILTIVKSKRMHTRCYFLISNVSLAAIIFSGSFVVTAVKRFIRFGLGISEVKSQLACDAEMVICYFGMSACASLPLATAADRFMATVVPIKYKTVGKSFIFILTSVAWGYAFIDSAFTFYESSGYYDIQLNCNIVAETDIRYTIQSSCAIAIATLVVIVYACILIIMRCQNESVKSDSDNMFEIKTRVHVKVLKSLSVVSAVQLLTQVTTRVGLALLPLIAADAEKWTAASFMRIIIFVGLSATFFIFILMNVEFHASFMHLMQSLPVFTNRVHPLGENDK